MILAARSNMESLSFQMGCSLVSFGLSDPGRFRLSDRSASASPVRASSDTGFRTTASATQSPWRLPSAGFAGVDPPSLVPQDLPFLTAWPRLWFSHPTHRRCWLCHWHLWRALSRTGVAFGRLALVGPSVCRGDIRLFPHPCQCMAAPVYHRYTCLAGPRYVRLSFDTYRWRRLSMTDIRRDRSAPHPPGATGPSSPGR